MSFDILHCRTKMKVDTSAIGQTGENLSATVNFKEEKKLREVRCENGPWRCI
jgi:hypothetical protein